MGPEARFWNRIRKHLPESTMARRLEVTTGAGLPDVLGSHTGYPFMLELKSLEKFQPDMGLSAIQRTILKRWTMAGLPCYLLAECKFDDSVILVEAEYLEPRKFTLWHRDVVAYVREPLTLDDWLTFWDHLSQLLIGRYE